MSEGLILHLGFGPGQLQAVSSLLEGIRDGAETACSSAINKTAPQVRTLMARTAQKTLNLKYADILGTMSIQKASRTKLSGSVFCKRRPVPLIRYGARQVDAGVSVQVRRDEGRELIKGAFIATMPGGHTGVFTRTADSRHRQVLRNGKRRSTSLPIKQKYGPTVVGVLAGKPGVLDEISNRANTMLATNLDSQATWLIEKGQPS